MQRFRFIPAALLAAAPLLAGCSAEAGRAQTTADAGAAMAAAAPRELTIRTRDFAFDAPDSVPAGVTTIRLINDGPDFHHVQLARLEPGHTVSELFDSLKAAGHYPSWASDAGGPNTPGAPGGQTEATLDLKPGSYVMFCFIPAPDGQPHVMKGMARPLTVTPATGPAAAMPQADLRMTLVDYGFELSGPVTAGRHTIEFSNTAQQSHEAVVIRLEPGKTAADFAGWVMNRQGPAPATILGGITGIAPGQVMQSTLTFTPGRYALICFVPDQGDGRPHIAHGMVKEFEVS